VDLSSLTVTVKLSAGARVTAPDISSPVAFTEGEPAYFEVTAPDGTTAARYAVIVTRKTASAKSFDLAWPAIESWGMDVTYNADGSVSARVHIPVKTARTFSVPGIEFDGGITGGLYAITSGASAPLSGSGQVLTIDAAAPGRKEFEAGAIAGLSFVFDDEPWQRYYQDFDFGEGGSGPLTIKEIMSRANVRETGGKSGGGGCNAGFSGVIALAAAFAAAFVPGKGKR
jgi:hypothetical protein